MAAKINPAETPAVEPKKKKGGISLVLVIVIVLIAAAGSAGGVWFFVPHSAAAATGEHGAEAPAHGDEHAGGDKKAAAQVQYLALDPVFVVNTADEETQHYLQADVQVTSHNPDVLEAVKTHMPRIRNNLLMLFAQQKTTDVRDRAGRERLQAAALKEVQDVLVAETGKPGVEALYFTSFVTQ